MLDVHAYTGPVAVTVADVAVMGRELGRSVPARILFATLVGYGVLTYFCGRLLVQLVSPS